MIAIDTSVVLKWFKSGERYEAEAMHLRQRLERREVEAVANEILSLEVVRGLKNAQVRQPSLSISDADVEDAFNMVEEMFRKGILLECSVSEAKTRAKEIIVALGLFMADALHLAAAIYLGVRYFVADDYHLLASDVVNYAAGFGVQVVNLPDLMAALSGPSPLSP